MAFTLSHHCRKMAATKRFSEQDVLAAANEPSITYESYNHPGQHRHVRGGLVAVVDRDQGLVITTYRNVERTALRANQVA